MGEAADQKVTEIAESRRQLESDLRELEARLPAPLRSSKAMAGILLGSGAFAALVLRKRRSKSHVRATYRRGGGAHRA